jgi:tryptophan halogenase
MFPADGISAPDVDEYNLQSRTEYEDVRDFVIAHYKVTRRSGEPFWDHVRTMDVPDTLNERLELFRSSGRFFKHSALELFAEESWVQVLLGQGLEMHADPVTGYVSDQELAAFLEDMTETIEEVAEQLPDHGEFVARLPAKTVTKPTETAPPIGFDLSYGRS